MLHKTRGIVLHSIKYSETSIIAHIYTEEFGRQSYLVKGAYRKKALVSAALFYPLNLLEMEVYYKPKSNLQKIKEAYNNPIYNLIPFDPQKKAIVVFISEVLYRTLREEEASPRLFSFIFNSLQILDLKTQPVSNFHLIFLFQLSKFIGFFPLNNYSASEPIFDLLNGRFVSEPPMHGHFINFDESKIFASMITKGFDDSDGIKLTRELRQYLLEKLVEYYRLHIENMGNIKSLQVLREVFD
jgi:DNA repair protein RecO (recombination protein O)